MIIWSRRELMRALAALPVVACSSDSVDADGGVDAAVDGAPDTAFDTAPDAAPELCPSLARINLVTDCGAAGDGTTNDTLAFQKAATLLKNGGELTIPPGTYIVGLQTVKAADAGAGPYYAAEPIFQIAGVPCLSIRGTGAVLKLADKLHYGGFDDKGQPVDVTTRDPLRAAHIGRVFDIADSSNVTIEGLEIDGNLGALILGGQWGNVDRQTIATGIGLDRCDNVLITDVHVHHIALDGITVLHTKSAPKAPKPHALVRVVTEYNGRQGLSWIGGWGLSCTDCKFNHTGRAFNGTDVLFSKPGAGVDIEPNAGTTDLTRDGLFTQCEFIDNAGPGMETAGGDAGYSKFVKCTFWGTTSYSLWPVHPGIELVDCTIHGTAVHASDGSTSADPTPVPALATRFTNCTFEDVPWTNGHVYQNGSLYNLPDSTPGVTWTGCTFINHGVTAVNIADPSTREVFDTCTFVFSNATLQSGSKQATIQGSEIISCHFSESAAVTSSGSVYFIDVVNVLVSAGKTPTHVDGPQVLWNSATTGTTGDIALGTYA